MKLNKYDENYVYSFWLAFSVTLMKSWSSLFKGSIFNIIAYSAIKHKKVIYIILLCKLKILKGKYNN
ncbi:hypothetical protein BVH75_11895 [Bacillus thuringiensis]|nr:hypothetical protein BVH75_11895 [Bacillus thuringiensis]